MSIKSDCVLYSVIREEHMVHNDFFLRYLELDGETPPSALVFACLTGGRELLRVCYGPEEIAARLAYAQEELPRYRDSSLGRILGLDRRPSSTSTFPFSPPRRRTSCGWRRTGAGKRRS